MRASSYALSTFQYISTMSGMSVTSQLPKTATIQMNVVVGFFTDPKRAEIKGVHNQTAIKNVPIVREIQISHHVTVDSSCLSMWPMTVSFFFIMGIRVTNHVPNTATIQPMATWGSRALDFNRSNKIQFQKKSETRKPPIVVRIHLSQNQIPAAFLDLNFVAIRD